MANEYKRLGELLVESSLLTPEQLQSAFDEQGRSGQMLGTTLLQMGLLREEDLLEVLQRQLDIPLVDLDSVAPDEQALAKIREEMARKYQALALEIDGRNLVVAMADPLNATALDDLRFHAGMFIRPVLAAPSKIPEAIQRSYHLDSSMNEVVQTIIDSEGDIEVSQVRDEDELQALEELRREADGRPIVRLVNWLLHRALEERASDIHVEPQAGDLLVRMRVDGMLREEQRLPKWTQSAIVSRIKILSNLDIAEKRMPQDGRLIAEIAGRRIDLRVSTLPMIGGEKVVMRVVDSARSELQLGQLGLGDRDLARLQRFLARPQGIVLVTGPTGSGKTTLLYSALQSIRDVSRNITTVEDPVEIPLPGVNQVQVDERARKTFATVLRSILRQDPDIIMVGEIRDAETAQIAFRAAVTGHLVLSTVHTNDAASAVTRLVDLGLEPFMVANALVGVVSMRLVRILCPRCREPYEVDAEMLDRLRELTAVDEKLTLHRAPGCTHCRGTGFAGRTGIFEVLEMDDNLRTHILRGVTDTEVRKLAVLEGMRPISEDGLDKMLKGITTLDEVARVVYMAEQVVKLCSACSAVLPREFEYCPECGHFVGEHCTRCHRRMEPAWGFCPSCGSASRRVAPDPPISESKLRVIPPGTLSKRNRRVS